MTTAVTVEHCTLRLVRHGGWRWGLSRRELVAVAVKRLPELLARELSGLLPQLPDESVPLTARSMGVEVRLSLDELRCLGRCGAQDVETDAAVSRVVGARVRRALATALRARSLPVIVPSGTFDARVQSRAFDAHAPSGVAPAPPAARKGESALSSGAGPAPRTFAALIMAWQAAGRFERLLSALGEQQALAWLSLLGVFERSPLDVEPSPPPAHGLVAARWQAAAPHRPDVAAAPCAVLRCWVQAAVLFEETTGEPGDHPVFRDWFRAALRRAESRLETERAGEAPGSLASLVTMGNPPVARRVVVANARPPPPRSEVSSRVEASLEQPAAAIDAPADAMPTASTSAEPEARAISAAPMRLSRSAHAARTRGEPRLLSRRAQRRAPGAAPLLASRSAEAWHTEICEALPFLLLKPLAKVGYWDALAALLESVRRSALAKSFALSLAYKVLPAPEHGVLRSHDALVSALAFAGVAPGVPAPPVGGLSALSEPLCVLDALVGESLLGTHQSKRGFLITEHRGRFVLWEPDGWFPIAVLPALRELDRLVCGAPVWIGRDSLHTHSLRELDDAAVLFVTDAPRVRGETWRSIRLRSGARLLTNGASSEAPLLHALRDCPEMAGPVGDSWRALRDARGVGAAECVEDSLCLAAGFALSALAWTLWQHRETPHPGLALERLSGLSGRVDCDRERVRVRLPYGGRYVDLEMHGLLRDVTGIVWLDGRSVRLGRG